MGKSSKSKNSLFYKQCNFTSPTDAGEMRHTAWIPVQFAVLGRTLYFGKKTDNPERLWTVTSVPQTGKSGEYIGAHERDYLTQRQASDI